MLGIVDYGVGNLFSLSASLAHMGAQSMVSADPVALSQADGILLPGVGAFGDAVERLRESGLFDPLVELARAGKPLLGICLGMQLLFDKSYEYGEHAGLGLIPGCVRDMKGRCGGLKVPQMGWNGLTLLRPDDPLLRYTQPGDAVYFVHSYYATDCEASLVATVDYGVTAPAIVRQGNVAGCQFHPEKSGPVGLGILRAFAEDCASC